MKERSIEHLSHFQCGACNLWWTIGDGPAHRKTWYCPWCGILQTEGVALDNSYEEKTEADQPAKVIDELLRELSKLLQPIEGLEKLFKNKS